MIIPLCEDNAEADAPGATAPRFFGRIAPRMPPECKNELDEATVSGSFLLQELPFAVAFHEYPTSFQLSLDILATRR